MSERWARQAGAGNAPAEERLGWRALCLVGTAALAAPALVAAAVYAAGAAAGWTQAGGAAGGGGLVGLAAGILSWALAAAGTRAGLDVWMLFFVSPVFVGAGAVLGGLGLLYSAAHTPLAASAIVAIVGFTAGVIVQALALARVTYAKQDAQQEPPTTEAQEQGSSA